MEACNEIEFLKQKIQNLEKENWTMKNFIREEFDYINKKIDRLVKENQLKNNIVIFKRKKKPIDFFNLLNNQIQK